MHIHQEGPSTSPEHAGALATAGGQTKAQRFSSRLRPGVDTMATKRRLEDLQLCSSHKFQKNGFEGQKWARS